MKSEQPNQFWLVLFSKDFGYLGRDYRHIQTPPQFLTAMNFPESTSMHLLEDWKFLVLPRTALVTTQSLDTATSRSKVL
jgi:hypothetical protein